MIRDAEGKPQPGVIVTIWPASLTADQPAPIGTSRPTSNDGTFTFGSLGPGEYRIAAFEGEIFNSGILAAPAFLAQFSTQAELVKLDTSQSATVAPKLIPASAIAAAAEKLP